MAKKYKLTILTPERAFFTGDVFSLTVETVGGRLTVLAEHVPMVTALTVGELLLRTDEGEKIAFHSEGFMEVTHEGVVLLAQSCEWPHEIDAARAREAETRARERLTKRGDSNTARTKVALLRAVKRLQVKERSDRDE